jgi:ABC-type antimicrobial peptide transport system permease subunit
MSNNYDMIKYDLLNSQTALSLTKTLSPITERWATAYDVNWRGKNPDAGVMFDLFLTDANWSETAGTTIIEGREIDIFSYPTDSTAMLLNESAVKVLNLENPIGETVRTLDINWHVVGVVKDFILHSPYEQVSPMLIGGPGTSKFFNVLHIKLNGANRMAANLAKVEEIFRKYSPDGVFEYNFVDEEYARKFREEQKMRTLATCFAGLTIFISCMGLFALVAYMAESRRKEIGIRKVLGASVSDVIIMLSKEFLILVSISIVVASPVAWWAMNQWLSNYAYRTNIPWWLFVVVGCISLGIALLTVGFQAFKAATENPVKAIKSE